MKLRYTIPALADLDTVLDHIAAASPQGARRVHSRLQAFFENIIAGGDRGVISAVNAHAIATVLRLRHGVAAGGRFWQFLADSEIEIVPFDEAQVRATCLALHRYGKGIDARARLNFSDCAAYALSKSMTAPLLFKGATFTQTDVEVCL